MSEEAKAINMMDKMTPQQQEAAKKAFQKKQVTELAAYKKGLREGNDLKKLQVEELELNIRYYDAKRKWLDLQPEVEKLDAEERTMIEEEQRRRRELIEKQKEEALKAVAEKEKPDIVIPKQGAAREG